MHEARCSTGPQRPLEPSRPPTQGEDEEDDDNEDEYEDGGVDDVNASDLRKPISLTAALESAWEAAITPPACGTESAHFASQLLEALEKPPLVSIAARSSTALDSMWRRIADLALEGGADEGEEGGKEKTRLRQAAGEFRGERTARRALLLGFLKLYTATEGTSKFVGAARLQSDCKKLIGHADHRIQIAALDVLCKWSQPGVIKYRPQLAGLVSDKQFRETLTLFAVDPALDNTMHHSHRPVVHAPPHHHTLL